MQSDPVPPAPDGPDGSESPPLTVAAAARRLGVAPSTLRTWDRRYGIGPGEREPGRHRRYSPDDVARLELMQHALLRGASAADAAGYAGAARLPRPGAAPADRPRPLPPVVRDVDGSDAGSPLLVSDDHGDGRVRVGGRALRLPGAGRAARGLGRAALALDAAGIRRLLAESIAAAGVVRTWDDVVRPVLVSVGQRWADTGAGVEIEHLISECVVGAFAVHTASAPVPLSPRPVLLSGMPGEQHMVPLAVLGAALADRRVETLSLGPDLPVEALVSAIRRTAPAAVVLWAQLPDAADVDVLRSLPRTRPRFRTFVAGAGWIDVDLPPRVVQLGSLADAERHLADVVLA